MTEENTSGQPETVLETPTAEEMTPLQRRLANLQKGKATRFQPGWGGNTDAGRTNSLRAQMRYFAARGTVMKDKDGKYSITVPEKPNPNQLMAVQAINDALNAKTASSRVRARDQLLDQIDGKLVQPNLNADLADLQGKSEEEIDAYIAELQSIANQAATGDSAAGEAETPGTIGEDGEQHLADAETGDTGGI